MTAMYRTLFLWVLAAILAAGSLTSCATTDDARRARSERLAKKREANASPKSYGLYNKQRDLDRRLLQRGQRARHSPSLDSY
jgi:hypothetical protein